MPRPGPRKGPVSTRLDDWEIEDLDRRVAAENAARAQQLGVDVSELGEAELVTRATKVRQWIAVARTAEDRKAARAAGGAASSAPRRTT